MICCQLSSLLENPKSKLPIAPKFSQQYIVGFFDALHTFKAYKMLTVKHFPIQKEPFTHVHNRYHIIDINDDSDTNNSDGNDSDANDSDGDNSYRHNSEGINCNAVQSSIY
jgi:hypothetical protein